jgi:hypothetical protein
VYDFALVTAKEEKNLILIKEEDTSDSKVRREEQEGGKRREEEGRGGREEEGRGKRKGEGEGREELDSDKGRTRQILR